MLKRNREDGRAALQTALAVLEAGWATIDEVRHANEWRHAQRPELGKLAMTRGKLSMAQVFAILGEQALAGRLFGETAVEMGLLNNSDVYELLLIQADLTPTLAAALATVGPLTLEQSESLLKQLQTPQTVPSEAVLVEVGD